MGDSKTRVVITGEDRGASAALGKVEAQLDSMKHALEAVGAVELAKKMGEAVIGVVELGHQAEIAAQKLGLTASQFSGLTFAAKMFDVDSEGLTNALKFLAKNMVETANGGGKAEAAFKALGVEVVGAGGKVRPINDVFLDLADKFEKLPAGATRSALSMQLFGRAGQQIIPVMAEGSKGIQALIDKGKEVGAVLTDDMAVRSAELAREVKLLQAAGQGLTIQFTEGLLPSLMQVAVMIERFNKGLGGTEEVGGLVGAGLVSLVADVIDLAYYWGLAALKIQQYGTTAALIAAGPAAWLGQGPLRGMLADVKAQIATLDAIHQSQLNDLFAPHGVAPLPKHEGEADLPAGWGKEGKLDKFGAAFDAIAEKAHKAVIEGLDPLAKKAAEIRDKIAEIRQFEKENPGRLFAGLNAEANQLASQLADVEEKIRHVAAALARGVVPGAGGEQEKAIKGITDAIVEGSKAFVDYDAELNKAAASIKANTATAVENWLQQIKLIETLRTLGKLTDEQAKRATTAADKAFDNDFAAEKLKDIKAAGLDAAHAIGTAFENAVLNIKGGLSVLEGLLQDIARTILRITVTKPLENLLIGAIGNLAGGIAGHFAGGPVNPNSLPISASGGFSGLDLTPGHAGGGMIGAAEITPINESGLELFAPGVSGRVISNRQLRAALGGGGDRQGVQVNVINKGQPADVTSQTSREEMGRVVVDLVLDNIERGGPMRGAIIGAARGA